VYRFLLLLLFAGATTASAMPPLFVAIPDHATAVDGGLSRGVAFGDADGDGDTDLLVANTINYPEFLYRNDGDRFVQVMETEPSLAGGFTEGVNWVDFDNDGDLDIFAARTNGPNALYRNDGNWSFTEQDAGELTTDHSTSSMACWADLDDDGWLDVFVVNRGGENDALYRNHDGRSFERITDDVVGRAGGDGRSCVLADLDGDDDPDLYVGNFVDTSTEPPSKQRNYLYLNQGSFEFTEIRRGHAVESRSLTYGTSATDADSDGDLDLFVTNIGNGDQNRLYLNDGDGTLHLHDAGFSTPVRTPSKGHTWGDFDLDGDIDVAIANGTEGTEHVRNELYLNDGAANFVAVTGEEFVTSAHISAGIAWADIDTDGDLDLYVANWGNGDQDNVMYQNQAQGTWLKLSLIGSASNRMGVGARVTITTRLAGQPSQQVRWLSTTTGYASQNEPVLHFGLAGATSVDTLIIDWPSGRRDTFENVTANQHLHISEGET
jgi:ASPIC/UnbV protein/VCBS repeat protein